MRFFVRSPAKQRFSIMNTTFTHIHRIRFSLNVFAITSSPVPLKQFPRNLFPILCDYILKQKKESSGEKSLLRGGKRNSPQRKTLHVFLFHIKLPSEMILFDLFFFLFFKYKKPNREAKNWNLVTFRETSRRSFQFPITFSWHRKTRKVRKTSNDRDWNDPFRYPCAHVFSVYSVCQ